MFLKMRQQGFTLVEMLVAVLMMAVLFTIVFESINSATGASQATQDAGKHLSDLQRAFIWMDKDINQLIDRPIRDAYGVQQKALVSTAQGEGRILEFSRGSWPNPIGLNRSDIVRVAYDLVPDEKANSRKKSGQVNLYKLYRVYWLSADRSSEEPSRKRVIATGVKSFKARYMDDKKNWKDDWPPVVPSSNASAGLPRAVEVVLELQDWGKLRRVFRVVQAHGL